MSEPCSPLPCWNAQHRRSQSYTLRACASALLLLAGCRLDPEGTAALPEPEQDTTSPVAEQETKDGSSVGPSLPSTTTMQKPVSALDSSSPMARVDAGGLAAEGGRGPTAPAARDAAASAGEPARPDSGTPEVAPDTCTIQGTYAMESEVSVTWEGSSVAGLALIAGGTGKVVMQALTQLDGRTRQATLRPCSFSLPDFETAPGSVIGKEIYGMDVPDEVWDNPAMPQWQTPWGLSCDVPGCSIFSGMVEAVVGARVTSMPFTWPGPTGPRDGFMPSDDDADGLLGLTLITRGPDSPKRGEQPYAYPPLVTSLLSRARSVMVATGMRSQMQGTLESCDRYSGTLSFGGLYARTLGCTKQFNNRRDVPCEANDMQFLDDHLPVWRVESGRFRAVRIDASTCAAVRALDFGP